jgi:hypothetical protein
MWHLLEIISIIKKFYQEKYTRPVTFVSNGHSGRVSLVFSNTNSFYFTPAFTFPCWNGFAKKSGLFFELSLTHEMILLVDIRKQLMDEVITLF